MFECLVIGSLVSFDVHEEFSESMVVLAWRVGVIRDVAWSDSVSCVAVNIGLRFCGFTIS